jgi:hypothetical protein
MGQKSGNTSQSMALGLAIGAGIGSIVSFFNRSK